MQQTQSTNTSTTHPSDETGSRLPSPFDLTEIQPYEFPRRSVGAHPLASPIFFVSTEGRTDAYITDDLTGFSVLLSSVSNPPATLDLEIDDNMPELEDK